MPEKEIDKKIPEEIHDLYDEIADFYDRPDSVSLVKFILRDMGDKAMKAYVKNIGFPI